MRQLWLLSGIALGGRGRARKTMGEPVASAIAMLQHQSADFLHLTLLCTSLGILRRCATRDPWESRLGRSMCLKWPFTEDKSHAQPSENQETAVSSAIPYLTLDVFLRLVRALSLEKYCPPTEAA